jgi:DNA topoisomerase-1
MANPRDIDTPLVDAYLARRALDYLVGFTLSPVLWRKLPGARSAGRVQSVALRLVCDRESEIERFVSEEYWQIAAHLKTKAGEAFTARLTGFDGKRSPRWIGRQWRPRPTIKAMLESASFRCRFSVEAKPQKRNPSPPFTTSTLQQAASAKLGFNAARTMQVAQKLYEGIDIGGETVGLITYMRTDGVQMAPEAIAARARSAKEFGAATCRTRRASIRPRRKTPRRPTRRSARPVSSARRIDARVARCRPVEALRPDLEARHRQPDGLGRNRAHDVEITASKATARPRSLRATGSVIKFDGFIAAYTDAPRRRRSPTETRMTMRGCPRSTARETVAREDRATQHFTEPPPRYSEASLIKKMEELGIGRPSTYASTLATLRDREYVVDRQAKLIPEAKGRLVIAFLENFFERYVEFGFTARSRKSSTGSRPANWPGRTCCASSGWSSIRTYRRDQGTSRLPGARCAQRGACAAGLPGARGRLQSAHLPEMRNRQPVAEARQIRRLRRLLELSRLQLHPPAFGRSEASKGRGSLRTSRRIWARIRTRKSRSRLRTGPFRPYVQRGEGKEAKRSSLPKGWKVEDIDHEKALALLSLPRDIGQHPETGKMISAGLGRYGPFVLHDGTYANLESIEDVFSIGLNRAVTVIAEKRPRVPGADAAHRLR